MSIIGSTLPNGAIVLGKRRDIVLCLIPGNDVTPFATWILVSGGDTYHGDYVRDLDAGVASLRKRAGEHA